MPETRSVASFNRFKEALCPDGVDILNDFIHERPNAADDFNKSLAHNAQACKKSKFSLVSIFILGRFGDGGSPTPSEILDLIISTADGLTTEESFRNFLRAFFLDPKKEGRAKALEEMASLLSPKMTVTWLGDGGKCALHPERTSESWTLCRDDDRAPESTSKASDELSAPKGPTEMVEELIYQVQGLPRELELMVGERYLDDI